MQLSSDEKRLVQADLTTCTFAWLLLSQKLDEKLAQNSLSEQAPLATHIDSAFSPSHPAKYIGSILSFIGFLLGIGSISSIVSYAKDQPVNLWLVLGVFAIWPMVTALLSLGYDARPHRSQILQSLFMLIKHSPRFPQLDASHQHKVLLLRWVSWKWQYFSLSFTLGSLVGFFVIIAFWDISFGWTSTLANSQQWMSPLALAVTWPSHFILGAPSAELLEASLLSRTAVLENADLLRQWWPYVLFAMFAYGFLSRLALFVWKYFRLKSAIISDIRANGLFDRYNAMLAERKSVHSNLEDLPKSMEVKEKVITDLNSYHLFGWQFSHNSLKVAYNFGVQPWQEDINWLKQQDLNQHSSALLLVNIYQTPVIELADLVEQITKRQPGLKLQIALFISEQEAQSKSRFDATWQQFSFQHPTVNFVRYQELPS